MIQELHFDTPLGTEVEIPGTGYSGRVVGYSYDPDSVNSATDRPNVLLLVRSGNGPIYKWSEDRVVWVEEQ